MSPVAPLDPKAMLTAVSTPMGAASGELNDCRPAEPEAPIVIPVLDQFPADAEGVQVQNRRRLRSKGNQAGGAKGDARYVIDGQRSPGRPFEIVIVRSLECIQQPDARRFTFPANDEVHGRFLG